MLEALLPGPASEIKGRIRSYPELLDISGYGNRPRAFKELMRILDSETRLLTPTDPEAVFTQNVPAVSGQRYYQLTHDYLVPPCAMADKEAEIDAQRPHGVASGGAVADVERRPERRQLPSLWEWIAIRLLTRPASGRRPNGR